MTLSTVSVTDGIVMLAKKVYVTFTNNQILYRVEGSEWTSVDTTLNEGKYVFFRDPGCDVNFKLQLTYASQGPYTLTGDGLLLDVVHSNFLDFMAISLLSSTVPPCVGRITVGDGGRWPDLVARVNDVLQELVVSPMNPIVIVIRSSTPLQMTSIR